MISPGVRRRLLSSGALATILAVGYVVLWASAYVPSKVAATDAPPVWFLVVRFVVAGMVMALIAAALHRRFPNVSESG